MSDHIKTSEQREEERRAGALDSTKDQALSKDSLQHVPATAWHAEIIAAAADKDIPTVITLEMLKGHLYRDMSCLQPYKTELLTKSSGFWNMDSPTSGRRVEPHLPLSALNKITGADGDRIYLDYQAKRFNFLSARFEETPPQRQTLLKESHAAYS